MINRRAFLKLAGVAALMPWGCARWHAEPSGVLLNDVHSGLNQTTVRDVTPVRSVQDIQRVIERAMREERGVSVAGGRHAMGGQQFGTDALHLDMRSFNRMLNFDSGSGLIEVEAGMQWPELIQASRTVQAGHQAMGRCSEANGCRSAEYGWLPVGQHPWARAEAQALRRRHRVLQARLSRWKGDAVQSVAKL
jgi:FAD/FMN-containing dehydrogenases